MPTEFNFHRKVTFFTGSFFHQIHFMAFSSPIVPEFIFHLSLHLVPLFRFRGVAHVSPSLPFDFDLHAFFSPTLSQPLFCNTILSVFPIHLLPNFLVSCTNFCSRSSKKWIFIFTFQVCSFDCFLLFTKLFSLSLISLIY
jgi:hypothetical protein